MKIIKERQELDAWLAECRQRDERIGFIPTMGALHSGHLSLLTAAKKTCSRTVVSIFVNPTQFAPGEDFEQYPRTFAEDRAMLEKAGCDAIFLPAAETIYPPGGETSVQVGSLASQLCGAVRPGHFQGVATVVTILFNIVRPHAAYFGVKDYQQFTLIKQVVRDLAIPVEVVGVSTMREQDGLAMSSRNRYLVPEERQQATALYRALNAAKTVYRAEEKNPTRLEEKARQVLTESGINQIDYVAVRHTETLATLESITVDPVMLIAVRIGKARLIDNMLLS